jgi:serine phosphatase RsbU (regulator of sigma subunit)/anti-sigma regulatory factor (Ser/Thr protein kinase)
MRTEDVLAAVDTGIWRWTNDDDVYLDAETARLLGVGDEAVTVHIGVVRAHYHASDYVEMLAAVAVAIAEGTVAETLMRVVGPEGDVVRHVMMRTWATPREDGWPAEMVGTVHEVRTGASDETTASGQGDWRRAREAFLLDAGRALAEANNTAQILRVAARLSMPGFSPDGLAVFGVDGDRLSVIGHHGHTPGDEYPFMEMPLKTDYPAAEVVRTGHAVYLPTPEAYEERYPATWPLAKVFGRQSWAFLPLIVSGRTIGAWLAAFRHPVAFTPDERSVLTTIARMLAQALSRARLQESERELSDVMRRTMLPIEEPRIKGMSVAARYVPTGGGLQVGGDWYDVIDLPSGRTAMVIGDVQGHDLRAAGLMGQLRIALRAYASEGHGPDAVLSRTSRFLAGLSEDRFATCLYMEVDPATGALDIARAGHPDPIIRLTDGTTLPRLTPGGLPLGIDPDSDYPITRLVLEPGETLLLCTDGLIETGGHDLETGFKRLNAVLSTGQADDSLEALADTLVNAVQGPLSHRTTGSLSDRREDDIALMLLRRGPHLAGDEVYERRTVLTIAQTDPAQIRGARQEVKALMHDWSDPDQTDAAALLVSELVTNVLVHTDEDAVLTACLLGTPGNRRLRVDVGDRNDDMPHPRTPGELASSGRGLLLIQQLSDAWGVNPHGDGKAIWFELHESPPAR